VGIWGLNLFIPLSKPLMALMKRHSGPPSCRDIQQNANFSGSST